jgi:hypothetical protein
MKKLHADSHGETATGVAFLVAILLPICLWSDHRKKWNDDGNSTERSIGNLKSTTRNRSEESNNHS